MDGKAQAEGEARVRRVLVEGLLRRGLAKPGSLTRDAFEAMLGDLCAKLAYMTDANLAALEEVAARNASGKDRDRFPIAQRILDMAADIQPPSDTGSPLMRAVFAHEIGRRAIAEGWAPELREMARKMRAWPGPFAQTQARQAADAAIRRMAELEAEDARGEELAPSDAAWMRDRRAQIARCAEIGAMGA
ncbi:hypothetical protein [Jannaschia formosa]|uniref:hypothetical protein n=1 Tax=Jannaschia formosa TaxID=2259592 RepID=UPI000E1BD94C|nr:hypothetical protein [Jannaschia formosa]TFL16419.1 hypothetical protein DR046_20060 [Jannaschia formosa]